MPTESKIEKRDLDAVPSSFADFALRDGFCPGQIGEMAVVHDALHLSSDSNTCMQICLPAALRSAPISGVSFGSTCYDLGFSDYAGHDRRDGVEYLTWLR